VLSPMRRTNTRGSEVSGAGARRAPWVAGNLWPDQPGLAVAVQGHASLALGTEVPATAVGSTLGLPAAPAASDALSVESQMNGDLPAAAGFGVLHLSVWGWAAEQQLLLPLWPDTATRAVCVLQRLRRRLWDPRAAEPQLGVPVRNGAGAPRGPG